MKFDELYTLVVESETEVVSEGIANKLKIVALATLLGLQISSLPYLNKKVQTIVNNLTPQDKNDIDKQIEAEQLLDTPSAELRRELQELNELERKADQEISLPNPNKVKNDESSKARTSTKNNLLPNQQASEASFLAKVTSYISKNEGYHTVLYRDVYKKPTIGIGHLVLNPQDFDSGLFKKGEYEFGKNGDLKKITLTDKRVHEIFKYDVQRKMKSIKRQFSEYDTFPEPLKVAILDGYFRGDISGSPIAIGYIHKAVEAAKAGNLKRAKEIAAIAAKAFLINKEYKASKKNETGVHKRMERNSDLIKRAFNEKTDKGGNSFDYTTSVYE